MPDPAEPGGATPAAAGAGGARGAADRDDLADLALLRDAAAEGGDIALGHARKGLSVTDKGGGQGPVTDADMAVDSHLSRRLGAARPGYGWLSEETADGPQRLTADSVFIVDPIDGTRAFIAGEDGWAVAVAVARAGRITAAVVALPARGEVYAAALGAGATLNGAAIAHSGCAAPEGAVVLGGRPVMRAEHWPGGVPPLRRVWRSSLAWRLCLVADGAFDAALSVRGTWEWDVAAGSLIAAEAGAAVSDSTGRALLFNRQPPRHDGVFVAPPALHATLLAHRLGPAGTGNGGSGQGGSDQGGPGRGRR